MYKYFHSQGILKEQPSMEKPMWTGKTYMGLPYITVEAKWRCFRESQKEYWQHIVGLKFYKTEGFGPQHEGRELVANEDFVFANNGTEIVAVAIPVEPRLSQLEERVIELEEKVDRIIGFLNL